MQLRFSILQLLILPAMNKNKQTPHPLNPMSGDCASILLHPLLLYHPIKNIPVAGFHPKL
jgi:hypothetical protein